MKKIDKIYYLCNSSKIERYWKLKKYYNEHGNKVEFDYVFNAKIPMLNENFWKALKDNYPHHVRNVNGLLGSFSCSIGHYNIISAAYALGLENIIVVEDDFVFNDKMYEALNNIPDDADFVKFGLDEFKNNQWFRKTNESSSTTSCIMYSRKAMKAFLDYMDNYFTYSDMFPYNSKEISSGRVVQYFCNKCTLISLDNETTIGYDNIN